MAKLATTADLDRLRDAKQRALHAEAATGTVITVGMGTCGIAAGARETLTAIREELAKRRIEARVGIVGCIGICVKEPLVDIQQAGRPRITYANVLPDMVPRLIEEQLMHGRPIKQWIIGRLPTE
jgi:NADP-reducing hydrogenase subunit HndB